MREALAQLDLGEWWHPLGEREYRRHLVGTLADVDRELGGEDGEENGWR